jgi:hypothetical protein
MAGSVQSMARITRLHQPFFGPVTFGGIKARMADLRPVQWQLVQWIKPVFPDLYANNADQLIVPFGSIGVLIDVTQLPSGLHRIYLTCPAAVGVPASDELAAFIGWKAGNFLFGSPGLRREEDTGNSPLTVEFEYSVHFEGTSQQALVELIRLLASSGLELSDEVRSRFGGEAPM